MKNNTEFGSAQNSFGFFESYSVIDLLFSIPNCREQSYGTKLVVTLADKVALLVGVGEVTFYLN